MRKKKKQKKTKKKQPCDTPDTVPEKRDVFSSPPAVAASQKVWQWITVVGFLDCEECGVSRSLSEDLSP
jgi:hypothetical protein